VLRAFSHRHPFTALIIRRSVVGVVTLFVVSVLIFGATEVLPGNAAYAVLGHSASPAELHALERQLHLDRSVVDQYGAWVGGIFRGDLGRSLANGTSVWSFTEARLVNSMILVVLAGVIGSLLAVALGIAAAARKDTWLDDAMSGIALAVTALPEFVVAITLVILFSTVAFHVLPGVSVFAPGTYAWSGPRRLVLPVASLVLIIVPYIFRMTRAAMIEALESEYVELSELHGVSRVRVLLFYALPTSLPPIVQVVALTFLYLAGGIVIVENVFAYPGIGQGLVNAVNARDIPVIQFIVLVLAAFYIVVNIVADVTVLALTPRRRSRA